MTNYTESGLKYGSWMILAGVAVAYWPLLATGFTILMISGLCKLMKGLYD